MPEDNPYVFVIDDDQSMRESLSDLLRSTGLHVQTFASAHEFLISPRPDAPSCLVLSADGTRLAVVEPQIQDNSRSERLFCAIHFCSLLPFIL